MLTAFGPVVVHLPATATLTWVALVLLAWLACRAPYLVWVHADPEQARLGQLDRGRVLSARCSARHARRGSAFGARLCNGYRPPGWRRVVVLARARARGGLLLEVTRRQRGRRILV